jgi:purine/pyrimidine-nucleoside phosphorylase
MSEFNNVTVVKAANIYFDGKVTSRTVKFADGTHKTLGIMMPGDYSFNTDAKEIMEILAGSMNIKLAGADKWNTYTAGTSFEVPANSSFDLQVTEVSDYCCSYIQ